MVGLYEDRKSIAERVTKQIVESIPDYHHSTHFDLLMQLNESVGIHCELWFGTLISGRLPDDAMLKPALKLARQRVHQGVSLEGFVRAYRLGTAYLWGPTYMASGNDRRLHKELLFNISPFLLGYMDTIALEMTMTYVTEQSRTRLGKKALKQNLWDIITSRPTADEFVKFSELLSLPHDALYCSAIIQARDNKALFLDDQSHELEELAERYFAGQNAYAFALARNHHLSLLIGYRKVTESQALVELVNLQTKDFISKHLPGSIVGFGLPNRMGEGWKKSLAQAQSALGQCSTEEPLSNYADIAVLENLRMNDSVYNFYMSLAKQLSTEPKQIETLKTWFSLGQNRKATAKQLDIHPNTLDHRLQKLAQLFNGNLSDPSIISKAFITLKLLNK